MVFYLKSDLSAIGREDLDLGLIGIVKPSMLSISSPPLKVKSKRNLPFNSPDADSYAS